MKRAALPGALGGKRWSPVRIGEGMGSWLCRGVQVPAQGCPVGLMGAPAATQGPFGPRDLPGLGLLAQPSAAELGVVQELNLEENQKPPSGNTPLAGKSWRPQGWCLRGRFLESLRRAEDGAGGQKETAPAGGVRSLEGEKEGKPALAAALPRRWLCGQWSWILSSSSSACCGAAAVSATGAKSRPDP